MKFNNYPLVHILKFEKCSNATQQHEQLMLQCLLFARYVSWMERLRRLMVRNGVWVANIRLANVGWRCATLVVSSI